MLATTTMTMAGAVVMALAVRGVTGRDLRPGFLEELGSGRVGAIELRDVLRRHHVPLCVLDWPGTQETPRPADRGVSDSQFSIWGDAPRMAVVMAAAARRISAGSM